MNSLVAVYGTLKKGGRFSGALEGSECLGDSTVNGYTMFSLGSFPGINVADEGTISVELYSVDDKTLGVLDRIEGYNKNVPHQSLYIRDTVETDHGNAFIYVYNGVPRHNNTIIPDGNWSNTHA